MKKRVVITFGGIILAIMGLMLSVMFLPSNTPIVQASASSYNGTFLNFRSATVGVPNVISKTFQHNSANFVYRSGNEIANLSGQIHGATLGTQNQAITNTGRISPTAGLTVFASGQGGNHRQWTGGRFTAVEDEYDFWINTADIDQNSLLERLRSQSGGNVYIAQATFFNFTPTVFPLDVHVLDNTATFTLYKLNIGINGRYEKRTVPRITDFTRHNIILWESRCNTTRYHDYLYNQLNAVLTQILYDYLYHVGQVPLLNMVSHSTGGVLNMMWANKHPHNVHSLFSFGGPFNGTPTGNAFYADGLGSLAGDLGQAFDAIMSLSGMDNMNTARHTALRDSWENAVALNPNLRLHAIGALQCMENFLQMLANEGMFPSSAVRPILLAFWAARYNPFTWQAMYYLTFPIVWVSAPLAPVTTPIGNLLPSNILRYMLTNMAVVDSSFFNLIGGWLAVTDDVIVSLDSAHARGFANPNNNIIPAHKAFRGIAGEAPDSNHVAHALMYRDDYLITEVYNIITMDGINPFYTTELFDNEVRIDGIRGIPLSGHITIPSVIGGRSVTEIRHNAFDGLSLPPYSQIISVELPYTLRRIGVRAFAHNEKLTSIDIPRGVRLIDDDAFFETGLTEVTIPNSVTHIGISAFWGAPITSLTFEGGGSLPLVIGDGAFAMTEHLGDIVIPNRVTVIGREAFRRAGLQSVIIEGGNRSVSIGAWAFSLNGSLISIAIPQNVTHIGESAFANIHLLAVIYAAAFSQPAGWHTRWNSSASFVYWGVTEFNGALYSLNANGTATIIRFIGNQLTFVIPNTVVIDNTSRAVTEIGERAFVSFRFLHVTVPSSIEHIGPEAFLGVNLQITWHYNPALTEYDTSGTRSFRRFVEEVIMPNSLTYIPDNAFAGMERLRHIRLSSGIASLDNYTFPPHITVMWSGRYEFRGNEFLRLLSSAVIFEVPTVIAGREITRINPRAFENNSWLRNVIIPYTITHLDIMFPEHIHVVLQGRYEFRGNEFLRHLDSDAIFEVPAVIAGREITRISPRAFADSLWLTDIILPNTVVSLDNNRFPEHVRVVWEGHFEFRGNEFLRYLGNETSFSMPSVISGRVIRSIGANAFTDNPQLRHLTILDSITYVGQNAFADTPNNFRIIWLYNPTITGRENILPHLEEVILPNNTAHIPDRAFEGASNLRVVSFGSHLRSIGSYAFAGTGISEINIPAGVTEVRQNAFYNTPLLKAAGEDGLIRAGSWVIGYAGDLGKELTLDADIAGIADSALGSQPELTVIRIESTRVIRLGKNNLCHSPLTFIFTGNLSHKNAQGWNTFADVIFPNLTLL